MKPLFADIHSHLVPGVDDGSRDEQMSRRLLQQAASEGIGVMIVTPHNYPDRSENSIALVKERFELLKETAASTWTAPEQTEIRLFLGNEVYYRDAILDDLQEGRALSMAGSRYVLTEFHPGESAERVMRGIRRIAEGGYRPVIAHIERIEAFSGDRQALSYLRDMGARLQVNTRTFTGGLFDKRSRFWRKMAAEGLISFVGSDAHHPEHRPVMMKDAAARLEKMMDEEMFAALFYRNALAMLEDRYV